MSTASNEIERRDREMDLLVSKIRDPGFLEQLGRALPENVTVDKFARVAETTLRATPQLLQCDRASLFGAIVRCAQEGLLPDGQEAAIVKRGQYASYSPMIGGLRKRGAEFGWTLRAYPVYENDEFGYVLRGDVQRIHHVPVRPGADRGPLVTAWASARHRDGRYEELAAHPDDISKRRALAQTDNVWSKWPAEMYAKTVARMLFKQLPLSETERDRVRSLLAEGEITADAATALYGPQDRAAIPAAETPVNDERPATSAVGPTEHTGDRQQADAVTQEPQTSPAAAAPAPGTDAGEEPDIGGGGGFNSPQEVANDAMVQAAEAASQFHPPGGKYTHLSLAEILAVEGGEGWLRNRLRMVSEPAEYVNALAAFTRVYAPEIYQAVLAEKEAS